MTICIMERSWFLSKALMASFLMSSSAFTTFRIHQIGFAKNNVVASDRSHVICPLLAETAAFDQKEQDLAYPAGGVDHSPLAEKIMGLTANDQLLEAAKVLRESASREHNILSEEMAYLIVLQALSDDKITDGPDIADDLLNTYLLQGFHPSAELFNLVISIWSKSGRKNASKKCMGYLEDLWSCHEQTGEKRLVPMRSSYISTMHALSRSFYSAGQENAEKAEALLEEMETKRVLYPQLAPNTIAVNAVLNAWSKSQMIYGAASRSEQILNRMLSLCKDRPELKPDRTSFNCVIDTLAKSKERDSEKRAETLLELMEELASTDPSLNCRPDQVSFNVVINCWAQSKMKGAARRATAILKHMAKRFEEKTSDIAPDTATYTTVLNAWARSREPDSVQRAEEILEWCEASFRRGNIQARPNSLTYNSMINCYAKSNVSNAAEKAMALLNTMKEKSKMEGFEDCHPDVVTYTSVIDTLGKKKSVEASEMAERLLEELEKAHEAAPEDRRLKPNVRTFTSAINAIGRSGKNPERAEAILNRVETMAKDGNRAVVPDVVCFNAVINAYGWSDVPGKSSRCFALLNRMIEVSSSGANNLAKPDIITCNSVLNACAYEKVGTTSLRGEIMDIAVKTLEIFQKRIPKYGYPDHATYSQVLLAMSNHMPAEDKRYEMAEATFWQCCHAGHVSVLVVSALEQTLPWSRFAALMGSALKSKEGERLSYDLTLFPKSWTRHTPNRKWDDKSKASRKRDRGYQVTKATLTQAKKSSQSAAEK